MKCQNRSLAKKGLGTTALATRSNYLTEKTLKPRMCSYVALFDSCNNSHWYFHNIRTLIERSKLKQRKKNPLIAFCS